MFLWNLHYIYFRTITMKFRFLNISSRLKHCGYRQLPWFQRIVLLRRYYVNISRKLVLREFRAIDQWIDAPCTFIFPHNFFFMHIMFYCFLTCYPLQWLLFHPRPATIKAMVKPTIVTASVMVQNWQLQQGWSSPECFKNIATRALCLKFFVWLSILRFRSLTLHQNKFMNLKK